jgi:hypothetical protein
MTTHQPPFPKHIQPNQMEVGKPYIIKWNNKIYIGSKIKMTTKTIQEISTYIRAENTGGQTGYKFLNADSKLHLLSSEDIVEIMEI